MFTRFIFSILYLLGFFAFVFTSACNHPVDASENSNKIDQNSFLSLGGYDSPESDQTIRQIAENWQPGYAPPLIEIIYFSRDRALRPKLFSLLQKKTSSENVFALDKIYEKIWNQEIVTPDWYPKFKQTLYSKIDSRFSEYFKNTENKTIRLDEIRWGGVVQNGIPPLRAPIMLKVSEADYLEDSNVVFGIEIDGDSRAYPKRILAWHEMFIDFVGGKSVTGAYCTLCGSMILYNNEAGGKEHKLGTSGFLYRSNKLMFDEDTNSFWNTLLGEPVVGPLVGKGIALERLPVVTTTWGQWKKLHPETTVLSLKTGHSRDYSEGQAYREYFATDDLMFNVPKLDKRLKNKACLLYTSPSPRDRTRSRMPSSA